MIQSIRNPQPESSFRKEFVLLSKYVELGIPVKKPRRHKLVKDTNDEGWQDGKHNVKICQRP